MAAGKKGLVVVRKEHKKPEKTPAQSSSKSKAAADPSTAAARKGDGKVAAGPSNSSAPSAKGKAKGKGKTAATSDGKKGKGHGKLKGSKGDGKSKSSKSSKKGEGKGPRTNSEGATAGGKGNAIKDSSATGEDDEQGKKRKVKPGSFESFGLHPILNRAIMKLGYKMPTPIQRKCIPHVMAGRDVIGMARTGSGKTAAFLLPALHKLELTHSTTVGVRALILSPTRELAMQSSKACKQLNANGGDLRICLLVGGQAMEAQFDRLAQNPDVVFATPGRLVHHMVEAELSLARVQTLIFDEADRLFELGFSEQIHKIMDACPASRQCLLFSATLPSQVLQFSRLGMRDPEVVRLDVETSLSESLELEFLYVRKEEKVAAALHMLRKHLQVFEGNDGAVAMNSASGNKAVGTLTLSAKGHKGKGKGKGKTAVNEDQNSGAASTAATNRQKSRGVVFFVATRHHVEFFASLFKRAGGIPNISVVYGNMDQAARNEQVARFHKQRGVLITTDVAARGIDIPLLDSVINYDFPASAKLFVHRAGRTARAGEKGLCSSLVGKDDLPYCMELLLFLGRKVRVPSGTALASGSTAAPGVAMLENEGEGSKADGDGVAATTNETAGGGADDMKEEVDTKKVSANDGILGSVPELQAEVEELMRLFASNDPGNDLVTLSKSMNASYTQYFKTRPAASKQSVRRARELLAEIGGPQRMQSLIHPSYVLSASTSSKAEPGGAGSQAAGQRLKKDPILARVVKGLKTTATRTSSNSSRSAPTASAITKTDTTASASSNSVANLRAGLRDYRPSNVIAENNKRQMYSAVSTDAIAGMKNMLSEKREFDDGCVKLRESLIQKEEVSREEEEQLRKGGLSAAAASGDAGSSTTRAKRSRDAANGNESAGEEEHGKKLSKAARRELKKQKIAAGSDVAEGKQEVVQTVVAGVVDDEDSDADEWNIQVGDYEGEKDTQTNVSKASARSSSKLSLPSRAQQKREETGDVGEDIFRRAEGGFKDENFFLSTDRTIEEDAKDRGLDLDRYELNIMGDDGKELQKQQFVRRWDAKKKKYLQVKIGADGKAVREKNRRNEAGAKVSGDAKRTDLYAKWSKNHKQRIQQVGELENSNAALSFLASKKGGASADAGDDDGAAAGAVEFDEDGNATTKKPIVPFFGEVDKKYLTNKQKRRLAKQEKAAANPVTHGDVKSGGSVTRSAADIKKLRKRQDDMKMKQDKGYREKRIATIKAAYWERQEEKIRAKQARPRSFSIWTGGKKELTKKQQKKKDGKRRRGVPL